MMLIFSKTDTGIVRKSNQDAFASGSFDGGVWSVVCDGMGGASGGDIASSLAVKKIGAYLTEHLYKDMSGSEVRGIFEEAIGSANDEIYARSHEDASLSGMGTTVVAAVARGETLYIAHAGDSRAYLINGERINRITRDHSMVQELVDSGRLTEEQARNHPRKNVITRALGVYKKIEVDHNECSFDDGDMVLLCTDGLSNHIEDAELLRMAKEIPAEELCCRYIDKANENGGSDNITALVIIK